MAILELLVALPCLPPERRLWFQSATTVLMLFSSRVYRLSASTCHFVIVPMSPRPAIEQSGAGQGSSILGTGRVQVRQAGYLGLERWGACSVLTQIWGLASAAYLLALMLAHWRTVIGHNHDVPPLVMVVLYTGVGCMAAALAWLSVFHQHWHGHPPRRLLLLLTGAIVLLHVLLGHFVLGLPFHFISVVLKPNFNLSRSQVNHAGQMFPFRRGEVLLLLEPSLKLVHLRLGEEYSSLPARRAGQRTHAFANIRQWTQRAHTAHIHTRRGAHETRNCKKNSPI